MLMAGDIVDARCVQGESDLPLALLMDVLRPLSGLLGAVSSEHRQVLDAVIQGSGTAPADRLVLGSSTLALLAAAAEAGPLLVAVDDAHWADSASGAALGFAVRRLLADRVLTVTASRPVEPDPIAGRWEIIRLAGLDSCDVADLLASTAKARPAAEVVAKIMDETGGNPLAVSHLARALPEAVIRGTAPMPSTLPLRDVAHRTFASLVSALPDRTQQALTVVAAAGSAAGLLGPDALREVGLDAADLLAAEGAGLIQIRSGQIQFEHPLYRAAALEVAGPAQLRASHGALASVTCESDPLRHAWHLGLSVPGVDEMAASVLEDAADVAERRSGAAAVVGLRQLAVDLSPAGHGRDVRTLAAGRAYVAAGRPAQARHLAEELLARGILTTDIRAEAYHLLAQICIWDTALDSHPLVVDIPDDLPPATRALTLTTAAMRLRNAGELQGFRDMARRAHGESVELAKTQPAPEGCPGGIAETLTVLPALSLFAETDLLMGAHQSPAVQDLIRRVREVLAAVRGPEPQASAVRGALGEMLESLSGSPAHALTWIPALDLSDGLTTAWMQGSQCRPSGMVYLLLARAELLGWTGNPVAGLAAADRAIELADELGRDALVGWSHVYAARICAVTGDLDAGAAHVKQAQDIGERLAHTTLVGFALHARARMLLGLSRAEDALIDSAVVAAYASSVGAHGVGVVPWQPDHVEILMRCGYPAEAREVLDDWAATTPAEPDEWHATMLLRCRVLLGDDCLDQLCSALERGALRPTPLEEARAQLVAGVALRRRRRPSASRALLRSAAETLDRIGARSWLGAAESELGVGRRSTGESLGGLTLHEARVAQEIAAGASTREAAARLFCSPKTVEYHLTHVYAKLGIRSRAALAQRLSSVGS